ncbi:hypothetical protein GCM10020218_063550 [Dactylosporangium vinaceum]
MGVTGRESAGGPMGRRGLRGALSGLAAVGLAFTNLPLLVVSVVALALSPVPFLGLALCVDETLVRCGPTWSGGASADRCAGDPPLPHRRRRGHCPAAGSTSGGQVTDPATWRDLAWLCRARSSAAGSG